MAFDFRTANRGMPALKLDQENTVEHRLLSKFDVVVQAIADLRVGQKNERVWYLLQLLGLLGVLAKAFKWI